MLEHELDAAERLAVKREVGERAEVRLLHQLEHLLGVVAGGEVAGDDRAGARAGDALPGLDRLRRVLGESAECAREREPLDAAAAEDAVSLGDPLHHVLLSVPMQVDRK